LVETVKAYLGHENQTLKQVAAARYEAMHARAAADPADASSMDALGRAENSLRGILFQLVHISESYPELKADRQISALFDELVRIEEKVTFARQAYNDSVTIYNNFRGGIPMNNMAGSQVITDGRWMQDVRVPWSARFSDWLWPLASTCLAAVLALFLVAHLFSDPPPTHLLPPAIVDQIPNPATLVPDQPLSLAISAPLLRPPYERQQAFRNHPGGSRTHLPTPASALRQSPHARPHPRGEKPYR
jgi:hypothetical protein